MRPRARGQGRPLPALLAAGPPRIPGSPAACREERSRFWRPARPLPPAVLRRMKGRRAEGPARQHDRRGAPRKPPPRPPMSRRPGWLQPRLFETGKDFTRFDERQRRRPAQPVAHLGDLLARRRGEARGWKRGMRLGVRRALIIVLSGPRRRRHYCSPRSSRRCAARDISAERAAEVLEEMGVLVDDRRPSFEGWLERRLEASPRASAGRPGRGCGPCATGARGPGPAAWRPSGVT